MKLQRAMIAIVILFWNFSLAFGTECNSAEHWKQQFNNVGERFSFAICADPQMFRKDNMGVVARQSSLTQAQACKEINSMAPMPAFTVFLGDLANVFEEYSVANFEDAICELKSPPVLVHGNHDGMVPYTAFKALMKKKMGFESMWYSFDVGQWHFVVLPCNLDGLTPEQKQYETAMLKWLKSDLSANRTRPTMVFEHLHALPCGLVSGEYYNFPRELRTKLMDQFTQYGNVKYYFNGHLHSTIKAALKMSWQYKGIKFIVSPNIIAWRPSVLDEEYSDFKRGIKDGGYYLIIDVNGSDARVRGRLAGESKEFIYPDTLTEFKESIEPRWFKNIGEIEATPLTNGDFNCGIEPGSFRFQHPLYRKLHFPQFHYYLHFS